MRSTNGRTLKAEMSECLLLSSRDTIPHLPGVNRLNMELKNEENSLIRNVYSLNIVRRLPIEGNDQIGLHASTVTVISSQPSNNYVPPMLWTAPLRRSGLRTAQTSRRGKESVSLTSAAGPFHAGGTAAWADVVMVLLRMLNLRELNRL